MIAVSRMSPVTGMTGTTRMAGVAGMVAGVLTRVVGSVRHVMIVNCFAVWVHT